MGVKWLRGRGLRVRGLRGRDSGVGVEGGRVGESSIAQHIRA
jgi:hypothetical protein